MYYLFNLNNLLLKMTKIIAEVGLNHMGSPKKLYKIIKDLMLSKIDGVTVQILDDEYYDNSKSFRKKIDMSVYKKISNLLKQKKIKFGIAIVNPKTIQDFKSIKVDFWKILSMKFFNDNLIKKTLLTNKEVYLSTGIVSNFDIKKMSEKYNKLNFIHTSFSVDLKKTNLLAISKLKNQIKSKVSFGLHAATDEIIISAITLRADSVFFYVKQRNKIIYPDHEHAINLDTLKYKVKTWREIILSLGNGIKKREKLPTWVFE